MLHIDMRQIDGHFSIKKVDKKYLYDSIKMKEVQICANIQKIVELL